MKERLLQTSDSYAPTLLRVALGIMMLPHGAQKLLGAFGGYGYAATMQFFTETLHVPALFAFLAIIAEFFGALGLILGCLTRVAAFGVGITMLVAGVFSLENGFFMNWFGTQQGEGIEFHLLAVSMSAALMLQGCGAFGIDRYLMRRLGFAERGVPLSTSTAAPGRAQG